MVQNAMQKFHPLLLPTSVLPISSAPEGATLLNQARTHVFQGICVKWDTFLLITGGYFDKNDLHISCNLLCGLWQLVRVWTRGTESCAENTFKWNPWKAIWQNMPVWIWFISSQPSGCPCALVDIHKSMFSCRSFTAPYEITVVFLL